ncbi:MAG: hypothetical protein ABJZ55_23755 [Fuerstiella sp.]
MTSLMIVGLPFSFIAGLVIIVVVKQLTTLVPFTKLQTPLHVAICLYTAVEFVAVTSAIHQTGDTASAW